MLTLFLDYMKPQRGDRVRVSWWPAAIRCRTASRQWAAHSSAGIRQDEGTHLSFHHLGG